MSIHFDDKDFEFEAYEKTVKPLLDSDTVTELSAEERSKQWNGNWGLQFQRNCRRSAERIVEHLLQTEQK